MTLFVIQISPIVQPQHHEGRAKIQKLSSKLPKGETDWWDKDFERHIVVLLLLGKVISLSCPWAFQASQQTFRRETSIPLEIYVHGGKLLPNACPYVIRIIVTFKWSAYLALCCELWQSELSAFGYELARRAGCGLARRAPCHSRPLRGAVLWGERWHASRSAKSCSGTVIISNYNLD